MRSIFTSPSLSLSSFAAPACLSLGAWGAPFLSSSSSSSHLCPFSSLYVSITHGYQHAEPVSVAQAWDWAWSGWTVWVFAGTCVDLTSDFSANDFIITTVYMQDVVLQIHNHISIEVISESHVLLCMVALSVVFFYSAFSGLWVFVVSRVLWLKQTKCSCQDLVWYCQWRFLLNRTAVRAEAEKKYLLMNLSYTHCVTLEFLFMWVCVFLSCACYQITALQVGNVIIPASGIRCLTYCTVACRNSSQSKSSIRKYTTLIFVVCNNCQK